MPEKDYVLDGDLPPDFDPDALDTSEPRPAFHEVTPDEVDEPDFEDATIDGDAS